MTTVINSAPLWCPPPWLEHPPLHTRRTVRCFRSMMCQPKLRQVIVTGHQINTMKTDCNKIGSRWPPIKIDSWNISELRGATTIPDGITTKGDGMGGLQPKVIAEDIKYDGANVFEDPDLEDSPYPEVRASVSNIDDPDLPGKLNRSLLSLRMDRVSSVVFTLSSSYHPFFHHRLGICYHWSRYQYIFLLPRTWAGNIAFGSTVSSCSCRQRGSVTNLLAIDIADSWRTRLADSWPGACLSMWYIYLDGWVVSRSI
jgi:hypothetical protein